MSSQPIINRDLNPPTKGNASNTFDDDADEFFAKLPDMADEMNALAAWMAIAAQAAANEAVATGLAQINIWEDGIIKISNSLMTQDLTLPSGSHGVVPGPLNTNGHVLSVPEDSILIIL